MGASTNALPPTGEQWQISAGGYAATVVQTGGGLRELTFQDAPVFAGYDAVTPISGGRGQLLLPWPNRIRDGAYRFDGQDLQLAISEPAYSNASHGLVRWCAWHLLDRSPESVRLGCRLMAQSGYPWTLDLTASYRVDSAGLEITLAALNRSGSTAPFAAGMHPYFDLGVPVDRVTLSLPATTHQVLDDRHLPAGTEPVRGDHDFRRGRQIGDSRLDDAFTDLARDPDGWVRIRMDGARSVELHLDESWHWVQVFTGDTLGSGRRQSLALEPMSAPADAFNSGTDLVRLEPGAQWSGRFRVSLVRPAEPSAR